MKQVEISEIIKYAEECNRKNIKWHFHILTPDCAFSKKKKYSIVFENEKTGEQLITFFAEKPPRQEKLEILFHGRV
ncbi:MAG: hypothetical protein HY513_05850 [Candidatus Aenigmarchaeota archaeon]|nr:hypothetical protein [Candidatus Aenigmarchaeota archaeon]